MDYTATHFWGMHFIWWLFWLAAVVLFFSPLTLVVRRRGRETPFDILHRRYAAGEISSSEYQERKTMLERNAKPVQ